MNSLKTSQCINPDCSRQNPYDNVICNHCGSRLLLAGRYRVLRQIGSGGFARTFEAVDEHRSASSCVVKQFFPLSQNGKSYERSRKLFEQEAEILKVLGNNRKIPSFIAFFEQEKRLYIVQEFIEGFDLFKEVSQNGAFGEQKVRQVLLELLPVLQFIHDCQVIHRDIKPSNIIRQPNGSLVLIDFGSSQKLQNSSTEEPSPITGTPGYASSEQMQGNACAASDIYSLGVTCMRLLSGSFPTENNGDPLFDWQQKQWNWRSIGNSVSPAFKRVLDGMLQWSLRDRFTSATEVLKMLKEDRGDKETRRQGDKETRGQGDKGTRRQGDKETRGQGDKGTREQGDKGECLFTLKETSSSLPKSSVRTLANLSPQKYSRSPLFSLYENKREIKISQSSKTNPSYNKLRELLIAQEYESADRETWNLMLHIARRDKEGCLNLNAIEQFPARDLLNIDRLWQTYSNGRFGFSIQQQIYQNLGGSREFDYEIWQSFGESVGWHERGNWLNYNNLNFSHLAPVGHLPACFVDVLNRAGVARGVCGWWRLGFVASIHRLEECQTTSSWQSSTRVDLPPYQTPPMLLNPEGLST